MCVDMHEPTVRWHSTLHIALLHPTRAALLMQPENGVWALPQVQGEGRMPLRQVALTNQMMAQVFGLHTTVLRYTYCISRRNLCGGMHLRVR